MSETIVHRVEEHAASPRPDWAVPHPNDTVLFESTDGSNVNVTADQGVKTQDQDSAESQAGSTAGGKVSLGRDQGFSDGSSVMTHESPLVTYGRASPTPESESSHGLFLLACS